jgi:RNA polymerase sigma factor (sigma-70 family)
VGKTLSDVVRDIGQSARLQAALALSDAQLLERFTEQRDETAFEALLHRHGPLVFGVCCKLLYNAHDAEDAFQATFLILARKAGAVGRRALLGNWLYGVAYRVAARVRKTTLRRHVSELAGVDVSAVPAPTEKDPELAPLLYEEVRRLPEKYRGPVVLCYLEGKTKEQAATELNCPVTTVKGRLSQARDLLRARLTRRGAALSMGLLATALTGAKVSAGLMDATVRGGLSFAAGGTAGSVSARAVALTKGVLQTMLLNKLKLVAVCVLAVAVLGGAVGFAYHALAAEPAVLPDDKSKPADKDKEPKGDREAILGDWKVVSLHADGKDVSDKEGEAKELMKSTWTFTDEVLSVKSGDAVAEMFYEIDSTKKPKTIEWTFFKGKATKVDTGRTMLAVYSLEGDTLKIASRLDDPDKRPTEVASTEGSNTFLVVLKRAGEQPKKPAESEKAKAERWKNEVKALGKEVNTLTTELGMLRAKNATIERALKDLSEKLQGRKKGELDTVLVKVDVEKNTVSATLGETKLKLEGVAISPRAKFSHRGKECTINDLKPGMKATLQVVTEKDASVIVAIKAEEDKQPEN